MSLAEKVCVIGLGYIGLPTSVILAKAGKQVVGVDVSQRTVDVINSGRAHIVEPDLDGLLHHVITEGRFRAQTEPEEADVFIIAVPTPFTGNHVPDLSFVEAAAQSIAPHIRPGNLVVLESTVPPGATEKMVESILHHRPDLNAPGDMVKGFYAAHCPERVLPGRIIVELVQNDRVVGGVEPTSAEVARRFYRSFVLGECVATTARTAELAKLSENAFRDVNIAFANELSMIADRLGVDVWELISLANRHPRVNILRPGPGVGGHCIAVDPWFIVDAAPEEAKFIRAARETNLRKTDWVVKQVVMAAEATGAEALTFLGLAYKPNVDDMRESPAIEVVKGVLSQGIRCDVVVVEPHVEKIPPLLDGLPIRLRDLSELDSVGLFVGLVGHRAFEGLLERLASEASFLDFCGMW